ncbi:hypothetical protein MT962_003150 [Franconibacter sp. IITDAS19]|uniref:hypothetical protein n=1 Tax=Franconibacter sp. IITDAS19 TaxID=2930569 RepID=UPI001FFBF195|nr:hypothetical protein [Franconibacter sp. IITDAS19]MCK1969291.1 hypothetical protein [Franconibacter sp. IITDAS19]
MKQILKNIYYPFIVLQFNKREFFVWFLFTIFCGQLGIIINVIIRYYYKSISISDSLYIEGVAGSFYTYSIALIASSLGPMFIPFFSSKIEFKTLKVISIILMFMLLLFSGVIYSAVQLKYITVIPLSNKEFNLTQPFIYIISVLLAGYSFGVLKLNITKHADIDDPSYDKKDDDVVRQRNREASNVTQDGKGVKV